VTAVLPYYGTRAGPEVLPGPRSRRSSWPTSDRGGVSRLLTMDLHADRSRIFNIPVDHLYSAPVLLEYIKEKYGNESDIVIVSRTPGRGAGPGLRQGLSASLAIIDKRRLGPNVAEVMNIIGRSRGRRRSCSTTCDTPGRSRSPPPPCAARGEAYLRLRHPRVLSGQAIDRLEKSEIEELVVTNTIPLGPKAACTKLHVLTVAPCWASHQEDPFPGFVSSLFV